MKGLDHRSQLPENGAYTHQLITLNVAVDTPHEG